MAYGPGRAEIALTLHPLAAESASGVSASIDLADGSMYVGGCGARSLAYLDLDVTSASGMGPVTSAGTAPPVITLSGTPTSAVSFVAQCLTIGALGTWSGQWSSDGGVTWVAFVSAATVSLGATGLTMAISAGTAALDNVWTASTPQLSVTLETSRDGALWHPVVPFTVDAAGRPPAGALGAFDAVAVAGWQRRAILDLDRYVRARWTLSGSGAAFTFALSGSALLIYAGLRNASSLSVRAGALVEMKIEEIADAALAASDQADQKLGPRYQLPLATWSMGITKHAASILALNVMSARGYMPEPGQRDTFKDGYDRAMDFFDEVFARGDPGVTDQDPPDDFNTGLPDPILRNWDRGWNVR